MKPLVRLLICCLLFACAMNASASMRYVQPGEMPVLAPDEGLVVIDVDSPVPLYHVEIGRNGKLLSSAILQVSGGGTTRFVYVATAGDYHLDNLEFEGGYEFEFKDDKEFPFEVKPGMINYPGDLVFRPRGFHSASFRVANRGLGVIDNLRLSYAGIYGKYPFAYVGLYPDPFPDFYRTARELEHTRADKDLEKTLPLPKPGKLPIAVEDLWQASRVQIGCLNPDGSQMVEAIYEKNGWHVDLIDLKASTALRLFISQNGVSELRWVGPDALTVTFYDSEVDVIHFANGPKGRTFTTFALPLRGRVLETPPGDPDHIVFESIDSDGAIAVHRLGIGDHQAVLNSMTDIHTRLDKGISSAYDWVSDRNGHLRAAIAKNGKVRSLFYGDNGSYAPVLDLENGEDFHPLGMSVDGSLLYGLSDKDRNQRDLVSFDPATRTIATVYSKPGFDIDDPVFGSQGRLIGASYHRNGLRVADYFDKQDQATSDRIDHAFPGSTVTIVDRDDADRQLILEVEKSDQPGRLYHLDMDAASASLLEEDKPWLDDKPLASTQVVQVTGSDGTLIEAYLTLPVHASGKSPLIVYSHGGPIGVRDSIDFDPTVQLFASLDYAVLQVNFRGSDGYGRAFREAGRHHYGSLIEDDIDAATRKVLASFPLDADRLCVVGASYGGYSALVSAIRWPGRFRCAVSIAGVSDQLLLFTASDSAESESGRKALVTAIGDPVADREALLEYAPLYRYKELTLPLLLVHGTEDERVDYEHTRRLVRMLNLANHPPTVLSMVGEGHGGFNHDDEVTLWKTVAAFLQTHLDEGSQTSAPCNAASCADHHDAHTALPAKGLATPPSGEPEK